MAVTSVLFLCLAVLGLSSAQPIELNPESSLVDFDLEVEGFEPVPIRLHRVRRQELVTDLQRVGGGGTQGTLGVAGPLFDNGSHRVDGQAHVSKTWNPNGPAVAGGRLDYTGPRAGASVQADHHRQLGTSVDARGNYNFYRSPNGRTTVDGYGGYQRSYGGQFGTSRPNWNVGATLNHRF